MAERNRTLTIQDHEIESLKSQIRNIAALKELPDSYRNAVIHGDILEALGYLPDQFADLIIIDPPYNLSKDYHGLHFGAMKSERYEEYLSSWFPAVCRKLKPNGSLYMCGEWRSTSSMQKVIDSQLTILNRITWQREKGRGAQRNWKNGMEDIWFAVRNPRDYYFDVESVKIKRKVLAPYRVNGAAKDWEESEEGNFRITYPSNFWDDISVPFWSMPENTEHPTQKPEKLYAKLILASSRPGDMIFDPFLGSGTAAVVAKKLGRNYCGVEINETYCLYAAKRLQIAEEDREIQGYQDRVFWERNSLNAQKRSRKSNPKDDSTLF